jgi:hypothetical protein
MQFTRFLRNGCVTMAEMSRYAGEQTGRRVAGREVVAIQDTSELVLGGRRARSAGYGPVGKGSALGGLLLHPVLAVEVGSEALLGLVSMQVWNRKGGGQRSSRRERTTAAKESQRWIDGMRQAGEVLAPAAGITVLCDREGDMYELFAQRPANVHLIVRACQNRRIERAAATDEGLLFAFLDSQPEQGRVTVQVPAAPGRPALPSLPCALRRSRCAGRCMVPTRRCPRHWLSTWSRCARSCRRPIAASPSAGGC